MDRLTFTPIDKDGFENILDALERERIPYRVGPTDLRIHIETGARLDWDDISGLIEERLGIGMDLVSVEYVRSPSPHRLTVKKRKMEAARRAKNPRPVDPGYVRFRWPYK